MTQYKGRMTNKSKGFSITINNPLESDWYEFEKLLQGEGISCGRGQLERGRNGNLHIQGCCEFVNPRTALSVSRIITRGHIENRVGTPLELWVYCNKETTGLEVGEENRSIEIGDPPEGQGTRSDLRILAEHAKSNGSREDAFDKWPGTYSRYWRNYQHIRELFKRKRDVNVGVEVLLYWGKTGLGKSRKAYEDNPGAYWIPLGQKGNVWFNDYWTEDTIVIEEFSGEFPLRSLLRLLDRYPLKVPTKGGFTEALWKKVIITSNTKWTEWYDYSNREDEKEALGRRLANITHFNIPL